MNKLYENGLLIGKFMPFHKGHELAINFGLSMSQIMHVLVSGKAGDNPIPATRAMWVKDTFPTVNVKWEFDIITAFKTPEYDEEGTAIDSWFWRDWKANIERTFGNIDAVFTNDAYGERLAKELNADWVPSDPKREIMPISATEIRKDMPKNWDYLNNYAQKFYQKKVVIVGPESTGKSSLTKYLATAYGGAYVPEYGRTLSEIKYNELSEKDFLTILSGHRALVDFINSSLLFVDTEAFTTRLYAPYFIPDPLHRLAKEVKNAHYDDDYDLYILLAPTVNWVDDGTRISEDQTKRHEFFNSLQRYLEDTQKNYIIISSPTFAVRSAQAQNAVYKLIKEQPWI